MTMSLPLVASAMMGLLLQHWMDESSVVVLLPLTVLVNPQPVLGIPLFVLLTHPVLVSRQPVLQTPLPVLQTLLYVLLTHQPVGQQNLLAGGHYPLAPCLKAGQRRTQLLSQG
jgi:hypothetical protein